MQQHTQKALLYFPTFTAVIILLGGLFLYLFGFTNLVLGGMHLILGAVGYLLFKLIETPSSEQKYDLELARNSQNYLLLISLIVSMLILGISTIVVVNSEVRPHIYFSMIAITYFIIFLEILTLDGFGRKKVVVLGQCVLLHLHLVFSLSLKYYYYFGNTDTLPHANNSFNIISAQGISGIVGVYHNFPLWHILTASSHLIFEPNTGIWKTMFLIGGSTGTAAILSSYSLSSKISQHQKVAYFTAFLVSASPTIVFYSAYSIPRSAIVAFLPIIFLSLFNFREARFRALLILLLGVVVLYHPGSPPFIILVLGGIVAISYISKTGSIIMTRRYLQTTVLAILLTLGYWAFSSPTLVEGLSSLILTSTSGSAVRTQTGTNFLELFNRMYYAPILTTVLIGTKWLIDNQTRINNSYSIMGKLGFVFFFVAAPGPLDLITTLIDNFSFSRWRTYVFPFILLTAATGLVQVFKHNEQKIKYIGIIFIIVLLISPLFGSSIAPDNPAIESERSKSYFLESETKALDWTLSFSDQRVYTDKYHRRLYQAHPLDKKFLTLQYDTYSQSLDMGRNGVGIYRYSEAHSNSIIIRSDQGAEMQITDNDISSFDKRRSRIYDSGSVLGFKDM